MTLMPKIFTETTTRMKKTVPTAAMIWVRILLISNWMTAGVKIYPLKKGLNMIN